MFAPQKNIVGKSQKREEPADQYRAFSIKLINLN